MELAIALSALFVFLFTWPIAGAVNYKIAQRFGTNETSEFYMALGHIGLCIMIIPVVVVTICIAIESANRYMLINNKIMSKIMRSIFLTSKFFVLAPIKIAYKITGEPKHEGLPFPK